jgi:hypothetical protein
LQQAKAELAIMLRPIVAMFNRPVYPADPTTGEPIELNDNSDIHNTKVEIYDFIRTVDG